MNFGIQFADSLIIFAASWSSGRMNYFEASRKNECNKNLRCCFGLCGSPSIIRCLKRTIVESDSFVRTHTWFVPNPPSTTIGWNSPDRLDQRISLVCLFYPSSIAPPWKTRHPQSSNARFQLPRKCLGCSKLFWCSAECSCLSLESQVMFCSNSKSRCLMLPITWCTSIWNGWMPGAMRSRFLVRQSSIVKKAELNPIQALCRGCFN